MVEFKMEKFVYIYTYGCQMNVHDTEKMLGTLALEGYSTTAVPEKADLIIFNTCAIREKAEHKFYSQLGRIKHLKKSNPLLKIAVAGCVAQDSRQKVMKRAPYVDFVIGPQNLHVVRNLHNAEQNLYIDDNPDIANQEYEMNRDSATRAWVSIMYGCNNYCSYCIVPYTRGREVSRPSSGILAEIRVLKERGYKEVTLLGQNVNSYHSDLDFVGLLREIDKTGIERVRFVTSHPRDLSSELVDALVELPSLCNNIHLPLQSGSDGILQAMNRKYSYAQYREKIELIRRKVSSVTISTDIIIGFPGESENDFEQTVRAVTEIEYDGMFAFKFSRRKGTRAYDLPGQVSDSVKAERLNRLLTVQEDIALKRNRALEGSVQEILVEGLSATDLSMLMGRTRSNKIVTVENNGASEGTVYTVFIEKARHHSLHGKILS
ncbi:MAG: tRNA (N6-isopentenyl adenosine(37)-C2)-methylthiotransferase MiaB [Nitrospirae bacterium]|nr:tRNA (N6-isopentenyl adenosine(37)-C2)-methylthiotransferase MiaB [Nitrospirota bacterium]